MRDAGTRSRDGRDPALVKTAVFGPTRTGDAWWRPRARRRPTADSRTWTATAAGPGRHHGRLRRQRVEGLVPDHYRDAFIKLDLGLGGGSAAYPSDLSYRLREAQRRLHDVSDRVLKLGGRVAADARADRARPRSPGRTSSSSTGPGPRSRRRWSCAGSHRVFVRGPPGDDARGARGGESSRSSPSTPRSAPRSAPGAVALRGDEIGLRRHPCRGTRPRRRPPALRARRDPAGARRGEGAGRRPARRRPAQRERGRGRSGARRRARRGADPLRQRRAGRAPRRRGRDVLSADEAEAGLGRASSREASSPS